MYTDGKILGITPPPPPTPPEYQIIVLYNTKGNIDIHTKQIRDRKSLKLEFLAEKK